MKQQFNNKILIIGYGAVSHCTLPVLLDKIDVPFKNVTIIDFEDKAKILEKYTDQGIKFIREKITKENLDRVLSSYLDENGLLIDLAWNIGCNDTLKWCHDHNVLYINTSVEVWDPEKGITVKSPFEKSLYCRQMQIRKLSSKWKDAPTAVLDHGANPGLISHFVKKGLTDIAERLIIEKKITEKDKEKVSQYIKDKDFARLAQKLKIKTIHCSERDTQITNQPKRVDEFVGTWSIEGLREEGIAPAEMGWGTHEKKLHELAHKPSYGPKNQVFLAQMGMNTWVRSWIPDEEIVGMVIRHGEAFGISDRLTVWKNNKAIYRPTVHYAYMPCHETISSLHELRGRNYEIQSSVRIMKDEIICGSDTLGALLMGHDYNSWWTGSSLTIEEARRLVPGENATTLQVAAGVVSAILWMIENPKKGVNLPDDLPHDFILKIARPYLGNLISKPSDWTPLKNRKVIFKENPASRNHKDPWQFESFLFLP
ncbi:MAG: saccharopine dehydrogenase NADP-binding domain-containing protein [Candidatus Nealsonbacteria bacterium]|nr:saccharopine dehydrogenase NADP-binding domain-containing protein [Candidatus Nealsonbacteria bacterium]